MEGDLPIANSLNAPLELCEQVKDRFQQFLNNFVIIESLDGEPSQSITHSQGSGAWRGCMGRGVWRRSAATHLCLESVGPPQTARGPRRAAGGGRLF